MARIAWTQEAQIDFQSEIAFIAKDFPLAAIRLASRIRKKVRLLSKMPEIGSPVEDSILSGLRELFVGNYRIIYRYHGTMCNIVTVIRAERDLDRHLPHQPDEST